jgi:hypothetical protein
MRVVFQLTSFSRDKLRRRGLVMKKLAQCLVVMCVGVTLPASFIVKAQRGADANSASQYLNDHEPELKQIDKPSKRLFLLLKLAPAALAAGDNERARSYSAELMALGEAQKAFPGFGPSMYSDATHIANLVLGQLALTDGDVAKAKAHLLAAGDVPGSPVLNSFGPNMLLAKELLARGEREVVVQYLLACSKFWKMQNGKLEGWQQTIAQGGTPDFGSNLTTGLANWRFDRKPI